MEKELIQLRNVIAKTSKSQIGKQAGWSMILKVAFAGLNFFVAVILARALGPTEYGIYTYVFTMATMLGFLAQSGLPALVVRETAHWMAQRDYNLVKGVWHWATRTSILLSVIIFIIVVLASQVWPDIFLGQSVSTFAWALLLIPLIALGNLRGAALRGLHRIIEGQLPEFVLRPGLFLLFIIGFAWWIGAEFNSSQAMALYVLAAAIAFFIGVWLLWRATPNEVNASHPDIRNKLWLLSALPLAFSAGMTLISQRVGIIILGFYVPASDIGVYRVAIQMATIAAFGLQAMQMVVAPRFADIYAKGDMVKLQRLVTLSARVILALNMLATFVLIVIGRELIGFVFGADYLTAYLPMVILLGGQMINSAVGSVGFLLNMTRYERETAKGTAISSIANIALNLLLIPILGINGAAIATSISLALWNGFLWWVVIRKLGINSFVLGSSKINE